MAEINNQNVIAFLREGIAADYGAIGFLIGMVVAIAELYRTNGVINISMVCLLLELVHLHSSYYLLFILRGKIEMSDMDCRGSGLDETIQTGVILIFVILVCYIGEVSVGGIVFFITTSFSTLGILPLLRNDLRLVTFFIEGAINTIIVKFSLGLWTWIVLSCCIGIVHLRNEFEQRVAILAASIEMRM